MEGIYIYIDFMKNEKQQLQQYYELPQFVSFQTFFFTFVDLLESFTETILSCSVLQRLSASLTTHST